jgi:hypothetical protein
MSCPFVEDAYAETMVENVARAGVAAGRRTRRPARRHPVLRGCVAGGAICVMGFDLSL